jgi:hypothetical protein
MCCQQCAGEIGISQFLRCKACVTSTLVGSVSVGHVSTWEGNVRGDARWDSEMQPCYHTCEGMTQITSGGGNAGPPGQEMVNW